MSDLAIEVVLQMGLFASHGCMGFTMYKTVQHKF